jgi:hypothetical protein
VWLGYETNIRYWQLDEKEPFSEINKDVISSICGVMLFKTIQRFESQNIIGNISCYCKSCIQRWLSTLIRFWVEASIGSKIEGYGKRQNTFCWVGSAVAIAYVHSAKQYKSPCLINWTLNYFSLHWKYEKVSCRFNLESLIIADSILSILLLQMQPWSEGLIDLKLKKSLLGATDISECLIMLRFMGLCQLTSSKCICTYT